MTEVYMNFLLSERHKFTSVLFSQILIGMLQMLNTLQEIEELSIFALRYLSRSNKMRLIFGQCFVIKTQLFDILRTILYQVYRNLFNSSSVDEHISHQDTS